MTTLPTIHLNGTGADTLLKEYSALRNAANAAADALAKATCNARDFYPQGSAAWQAARAERDEAFRMLNAVIEYAEAWELRAMDAKRGKDA